MPKLRAGFADLRISTGLETFPGLLGYPRTDLAAHFHTGLSWEPAGFQVNVALGAGRHTLIVEALEVEGVWQEVGVHDVEVDAHQPPVDFALLTAPVRGREFGHLLHSLLTTSPARGEIANLAQQLVSRAPFPRDLLRSKPPFFGRLETPEAFVAAPDDFIELRGHLFHAETRIVRLMASVDLQIMQPLSYGETSLHIQEQYPRIRHAKTCGFSGRILLPSQLPNPVAIRIFAELADGAMHLVHVARVHRRSAPELTRAIRSDAGACIDEAVTALRRAIAGRQLALVTDNAFESEIARLRAAVEAKPVRPSEGPMISIESTCHQTSESDRASAGLPVSGYLIAVLAKETYPAVVEGLKQAIQLLRQRHPTLDEDIHVLMAGSPSPGRTPGIDGNLFFLENEASLRLADLIIRLDERADRAMSATGTVALAETIARRLYRRRSEINETTTVP